MILKILALAPLAACLYAQQVDYKNLVNGPTLYLTRFDFKLIPGNITSGSLTATGAKTLGVRPCPLGVSGTDTDHYLRIAGGTGTDETVLITGGTCASGAASGTLQFTTVNTHTGNWSIISATSGIQETINSLPSTGGTVVLPATTLRPFRGFTVAARSGVTVAGQGVSATRIDIRSLESGHVAKLTTGSANWLREFSIGGFGASPGMTGSDYAIIFDDQNSSGVEHVDIAETTNGVHVTDNTAMFGNYRIFIQYVNMGYLSGSGRTGILIEGGADHFLSHLASGGMTAALASIRIRKSGGTTIQNVDMLNSGLLIDPDGVGAYVAWVFLNAAMFDTTTQEPWKIAPTNGAIVQGIVATNCWFASSVNNAGVRFQATLPSKIEDIVINASRVINNSTHGIALDGTGVRDITLTSNIIASNSTSGSGAAHGVFVQNASDLIITQNNIGAVPGFFANQATGVFFATGGTNNVVVKDNIIKDFTVTPIAGMDAITGLDRIVKDNAPSSYTQAVVPSATALNLTTEAYEHFAVTGTTAVTSMDPVWYGRQIYLTKTDGGTVNFNTGGNIKIAKTLTAGQTLICVYTLGGWGIVGP